MRCSLLRRNDAARLWEGLVVILVVMLAGVTVSGVGHTAPLGPYLNGAFPPTAPDSEFGVVDAFPLLEFPQAVQLVPVPRRAKLAVVVKAGRIDVIDADENARSKSVLVDLRGQTNDVSDGGLLGIAFHPNFGLVGATGERSLYVYYRYTPNRSYSNRELAYNRLSRFDVDPDTLVASVASEQVLIQQFDLHGWHNGGCLRFGSDGFLYVSVGDMGAPELAAASQQQISRYLMSGVLRIDVDQDATRSHAIRRQPQTPPGLPTGWPESFSRGYLIPNDNPWLSASGEYLEEFYAMGIRSPHRMSFDPVTNDLWLGDVGYTTAEDITIVRKGDNLQWPYREGFFVHSEVPSPLIGTERPPVHSFPSGAVIGGFVYRASRYGAELGGKYLYADFNGRTLFSLTHNTTTDVWEPSTVVRFSDNGVNLGLTGVEDIGDGHVYLLGFGEAGKIFRLEPLPPAAGAAPESLAAVGAFTDLASLTPVEGLLAYDVNTPLWSDRAEKARFIGIPNDGTHDTASEQIQFAEQGPWGFPAGTVFVKHFELPLYDGALPDDEVAATTRLETRFLIIGEDRRAYGLTYRWNDEGTDAFLLAGSETRDIIVSAEDGATKTQTWTFPSPTQCLECHTSGAGYALGLQTWQLNRPSSEPGSVNQLQDLLDRGVFANAFEPALIDTFPRGHALNDAASSPADRVHSYLAANCSHCHFPGGVASLFDARFQTPLDHVIGLPTEGHSSTEEFLVAPSDRWQSELYIRDASLGNGAMPPLAKAIVDDEYTDLLGSWIDGLGGQSCTSEWLPTSSLTAISASSEDLPYHQRQHAFDTLSYTVWHTAWRDGDAPPPHEIVVHLGGVHTIDAINYLPRQDPETAGTIIEYALYLSDDGVSWGEPVSTGSWSGSKLEQVATFAPAQGQYARFVALRQLDDHPSAVVAELGFRASTCIEENPTGGDEDESETDEGTSGPPASDAGAIGDGGLTDAASNETPGDGDASECASEWSPTDEWSVVYTDSQDALGHLPEHIFDGLPYTVWHTSRSPDATLLPHEIVIDLGRERVLDAFSYLPRQDESTSGMIGDFEFYVSSDLEFAAPAIATGTFANDKQLVVTAFAATSGRYIKLVALSEYGLNGRTVVAELGVRALDCQAGRLAETNQPSQCLAAWASTEAWSVAYVDSEDTRHLAEHAFDGLEYSVWHTDRQNSESLLPHELVIDLGSEQLVDAFSYLPRQDPSSSGMIENFEFYVSSDLEFDEVAVSKGTFQFEKQATVVSFEAKSGRYVRLVAKSEYGPSGRTVVAELGVRTLSCAAE